MPKGTFVIRVEAPDRHMRHTWRIHPAGLAVWVGDPGYGLVRGYGPAMRARLIKQAMGRVGGGLR